MDYVNAGRAFSMHFRDNKFQSENLGVRVILGEMRRMIGVNGK
jgi:hypothetical protein